MTNNKKIFLYIDNEDLVEFNNYQLSHLDWGLSDDGFQVAYLLEKHLGNTKKYIDDNLHITRLIGIIEKLTDECNDFSIKIYDKRYSDSNLLNLAIRNVNTRIEAETNEETRFRILHLIKNMYMKSSLEIQNKSVFLYIPESLCKLAISNNDINLMIGIMPLIFRDDRDKIFKWSLLYGNIAIANSIVDFDRNNGRMKHQRWLEKNGAWPLIEPIKDELNETVISESNNYYLVALEQAIAQNFPMDEESSEFTLLFPFSNEYNYKKVLDKISILNKIDMVKEKNTNKIGVCLLFGESHFLSLLSVIKQRAKIVILSDVVQKQWMHIEHMLVCLDKSEKPEDFIQFYLNGNPILNESVGEESLRLRADLVWLTETIKGGGSLGNYNFLSCPEKFKECKQAAKELIFVQIKLDLMDELKCQELDALLSSNNAAITFCNLTNIHDYDDENKLPKSIPVLLQSSPHCLVMYSTKLKYSERNDLYTYVSKGLDKYFQSCLKKAFVSLKKISITSNDQFCDEKKDIITLSKSVSDPMFGVGIFSPKTTSLKLISSKNNNDKQENQRNSNLLNL